MFGKDWNMVNKLSIQPVSPVILCIIFCSLSVRVQSQNLVRNHDFEQVKDTLKVGYYYHTQQYGSVYIDNNLQNTVAWSAPTTGTPDLAGFKTAGIPHSGRYMAQASIMGTHYEYLQGQLKKPLEKGKAYIVELHVKSYGATFNYPEEIGWLFCSDSLFVFGQKNLDSIPDIIFNIGKQGKDLLNWVALRDTIVASGGERFFTIGNFKSMRNSSMFSYGDQSMNSLFLLYDDITVVPLFVDSAVTFSDSLKRLETGQSIVLKNVLFEKDKAALQAMYNHELNNVAAWLSENGTLEIVIAGYTDNDGNDAYNLKLSVARAESVKQYLVQQGVATHRISVEGYGKQYPLAANDTDAGKAINRRIELKLKSK